MTKEDKLQLAELEELTEKLSKFSKHFDTATHGYIRITPEDTRRLLEAFHGPDWKSKVKPSVMTCSSCKMAEIRSIAMEYYAALNTIQTIKENDKKKKEKDVEQQKGK